MKARIYHSAQRNFECKVLETGERVLAVALGNLLKEGEVVVGDFVELQKGKGKEYQICHVQPRQNELFRMIQREGKKKVMASNCDVMCIVMSASFPLYKRGLVDRYLVRCLQWDISPLLIFNKMDEYQRQEGELDIAFEAERLKFLPVPCFVLSALNPDTNYAEGIGPFAEKGMRELREVLRDKTVIFLGQSGVGKSKLITTLSDGQVNLKSRELGKVLKGAHTTSWAEMVDCHEFTCIDSPGIRSFSLDDVKKEELLSFFPDLYDLAVNCQFPNCQHVEEGRGCFFYREDAMENQRDRELILSRLESYHQILKEVGARPSWEKKEL